MLRTFTIVLLICIIIIVFTIIDIVYNAGYGILNLLSLSVPQIDNPLYREGVKNYLAVKPYINNASIVLVVGLVITIIIIAIFAIRSIAKRSGGFPFGF